MEERLGFVGGKPSRYRERILEANGITNRHYAIDEQGNQTHLNQDLAAEAVLDARCVGAASSLARSACSSVGATMPDLLMPGFASMVHGRLAEVDPTVAAMEVLSASGICASGAAALRSTNNAVRVGDHHHAVGGRERTAVVDDESSRFEQESGLAPERDDVATAYEYFNADFLRWMLSDGAGAVVVEAEPHPTELSFRVDSIELTSCTHARPDLHVPRHLRPRTPHRQHVVEHRPTRRRPTPRECSSSVRTHSSWPSACCRSAPTKSGG